MALTSLPSRSASPSLVAAVSAAMVASAVWYCSSAIEVADAEDAKEEVTKLDETDPDYLVPDGTPEEIMEFIEKLKARKTKFANRQEAIDHAIKLHRASIDAGDKILNQDTDAKVAANAAKLKLSSLTVLAANEIGDAAKAALSAVQKLKKDPREKVAKIADQFSMPIRIFSLSELAEADRKELTDEILALVSKSHFGQEPMSAATTLGDTLAEKGFTEAAGEFYEQLAKLAREADDPKIAPNASRFDAIARRLRLPGHFLALEGKVLNGDEFDWTSYRGKVVLVDFWATWCGPCVAELPNVKRNYQKYHDKGFEVVGISLDHSRAKLDQFIEKTEIPWTQLYDEEQQKESGWSHPMAERYGVSSIPAAFLVDQEGNVVSLRARGPELSKLLEKLLGGTK